MTRYRSKGLLLNEKLTIDCVELEVDNVQIKNLSKNFRQIFFTAPFVLLLFQIPLNFF